MSVANDTGNYIGIYCAAFVGFPILAHILDRYCGCVNEIVSKLGKQGEVQILKEKKVKDNNDLEVNSPNHDIIVQKTDNKDNYSGPFLQALVSNRVYYNTYTNSSNEATTLAQIMRSDSLFILFNTDPLLSTFCCLPGHSYSRYERRMGFITQHGLALFLCIIAFAAFDTTLTRSVFNILFVTPVTVFVNSSFYYITACPCAQGDWNWCLQCICKTLESLGTCFAHFYSLVSILLLIIAGVISYNIHDSKLSALSSYVLEVFVVSCGYSLVSHILKIHFFTYVCVKFCGIIIFDDIGKWFYEYIKYNNLPKEKYYTEYKVGCLMTIEIWYPTIKKSGAVSPEFSPDNIVVGEGLLVTTNASENNEVSSHHHRHHEQQQHRHHNSPDNIVVGEGVQVITNSSEYIKVSHHHHHKNEEHHHNHNNHENNNDNHNNQSS